MEKDRPSKTDIKHNHRGKFTENLVEAGKILETLSIKAGQTVVDAGCGNGYMSKLLAERTGPSGIVYALDTDNYFIEILKKETENTNIHAMLADITVATELKTSSVDLVYISTVLHGLSREKRQGFIDEAQRILRQNGHLAIVEFDKKETAFGPPIELRYSPEELQEILPFTALKTSRAGEHFYLQLFQNS